jgi:hypothetical protein
MVEKQWFDCHAMVGSCLNSGSQIRICPAEFSTDFSTQTRLLQDLYSSWILISTIQNHTWGLISCDLGWLRSNSLVVMIVGPCLNSGSQIRIRPAEFSTDLSAQMQLTNKVLRFDGGKVHSYLLILSLF